MIGNVFEREPFGSKMFPDALYYCFILEILKNEKVANIIIFSMNTRLTNITDSSPNLMLSTLEMGPIRKGLPRFETSLLRTQFVFC